MRSRAVNAAGTAWMMLLLTGNLALAAGAAWVELMDDIRRTRRYEPRPSEETPAEAGIPSTASALCLYCGGEGGVPKCFGCGVTKGARP
jgi:hypothetical protein